MSDINAYTRDLIHRGITSTAFISYDYADGHAKVQEAVNMILEVIDSLNSALGEKEKRRTIYDLLQTPEVQKLILICAQNDIRFTKVQD